MTNYDELRSELMNDESIDLDAPEIQYKLAIAAEKDGDDVRRMQCLKKAAEKNYEPALQDMERIKSENKKMSDDRSYSKMDIDSVEWGEIYDNDEDDRPDIAFCQYEYSIKFGTPNVSYLLKAEKSAHLANDELEVEIYKTLASYYEKIGDTEKKEEELKKAAEKGDVSSCLELISRNYKQIISDPYAHYADYVKKHGSTKDKISLAKCYLDADNIPYEIGILLKVWKNNDLDDEFLFVAKELLKCKEIRIEDVLKKGMEEEKGAEIILSGYLDEWTKTINKETISPWISGIDQGKLILFLDSGFSDPRFSESNISELKKYEYSNDQYASERCAEKLSEIEKSYKKLDAFRYYVIENDDNRTFLLKFDNWPRMVEEEEERIKKEKNLSDSVQVIVKSIYFAANDNPEKMQFINPEYGFSAGSIDTLFAVIEFGNVIINKKVLIKSEVFYNGSVWASVSDAELLITKDCPRAVFRIIKNDNKRISHGLYRWVVEFEGKKYTEYCAVYDDNNSTKTYHGMYEKYHALEQFRPVYDALNTIVPSKIVIENNDNNMSGICFTERTVDYLHAKIYIKSKPSGRRKIHIDSCIRKEGKLFSEEFSDDVDISDTTEFIRTTGWGNKNRTCYKPGEYTFCVTIDGHEYSQVFTILKDKPVLESIIMEDYKCRKSGAYFTANTFNGLHAVLRFSHIPEGKKDLTIKSKLLFEGNEFSQEVVETIDLTNGGKEFATTDFGDGTYKAFKPGKYVYKVSIEDEEYAITFEVGKREKIIDRIFLIIVTVALVGAVGLGYYDAIRKNMNAYKAVVEKQPAEKTQPTEDNSLEVNNDIVDENKLEQITVEKKEYKLLQVAPINRKEITIGNVDFKYINGSIDENGEGNSYDFKPPVNGRYRFDFSGMHASCTVRFQIYDSLDNAIVDKQCKNGEGVSYNSFSNEQKYRLVITPVKGASDYKLRIGQQKERTDISEYTSVRDSIEFTEQKNIYYYTVGNEGRLHIEVNDLYAGTKVEICVWNSLDEYIVGQECASGEGIVLKSLVPGDKYMIQVRQNTGFSDYVLNIFGAKEKPDITEYTEISDSIEFVDQRNVYYYTPTEDEICRFSFYNLPVSVSVQLRIYDSKDNIYANDYFSNGEGITVKDMKAGETYGIQVLHHEGLGGYDMRILSRKKMIPIKVNSKVEDDISYPEQINYYSLSVEAGKKYNIALTSGEGTINVFNELGYSLVTGDGKNITSYFTANVDRDQTYTISVRSKKNAVKYSLCVEER